MPHIIVKLVSGNSEQQKQRLTEAITRDVTDVLGYGDDAVSVALEDVAAEDWIEQVFEPDIRERSDVRYRFVIDMASLPAPQAEAA